MPSNLPVYKLVEEGLYDGTIYFVLTHGEAHYIPENIREAFLADEEATHVDGHRKTIYITPHKASSTTITSNVTVRISEGSAEAHDYIGNATDFLSSAYKFWRKSKPYTPPVVSLI